MSFFTQEPIANNSPIPRKKSASSHPVARVALLTGCQDGHYVYGLAMALASLRIELDIIGNSEVDSPDFHGTPNLHFLTLRNQGRNDGPAKRLLHLLGYYLRLIGYAANSKASILHILWNNRFEYFDRTVLTLYYKVLGRKVALTVHNVNQARRDSKDSWLNRLTLRIQYQLCDHFFVHTQRMKDELCREFRVAEGRVTVIRFPVNVAMPKTKLTPAEAKRHLGLNRSEKVVLFLGRIRPYKGVEYLLEAFQVLATRKAANYRLIVAGEPKKGSEDYLKGIRESISKNFDNGQVILRIEFIPDEEVEIYLKAADVLVLPYKEIFQSGVLFLAYSFGLPVVATDVGSFRDEIVEGVTGFVCKPGEATDLAAGIETYFASDLYKELDSRRSQIEEYAHANHSWEALAELTAKSYIEICGGDPISGPLR